LEHVERYVRCTLRVQMKWACARALGVVLTVDVFAARGAAAMGAVVGPANHPASIARARVAVAVADGRTTRWAQISPAPNTGGFAWLVPVEPGACVDLASDAWLDALDAATVPVVFPPAAPTCLLDSPPQVLAAATSPSSLRPAEVTVALDLASLTWVVGGEGFEVSSDLAELLGGVFSSGGAILVLAYVGGEELPVHTLRIVDTASPILPFALTGNPDAPVEVSAFAIAGNQERAGASSLSFPTSDLAWLSDGGSNYAGEARSLLSSFGDTQWLLQNSGTGVFFQPTTITSGLTLPAVASNYYALASTYGDTTADPDACNSAAQATMDDASPYAAACPGGALAVVPGPSPCDVVSSAGETPYDGLVCGGAVDAALAVALLPPSNVWVTRWAGAITATSASNVPLTGVEGAPVSVVLTATSSEACSVPEGGVPVSGPASDGGLEDDGGSTGGDGEDGFDGGATYSGCAGCYEGGGPWGSGTYEIAGGGDGAATVAAAVDASSDGCDSSSSDDSGDGCDGDADPGVSGGCSGNTDVDTCTLAKRLHPGRGRSLVSRILFFGLAALGVLRRRVRGRTTGAWSDLTRARRASRLRFSDPPKLQVNHPIEATHP